MAQLPDLKLFVSLPALYRSIPKAEQPQGIAALHTVLFHERDVHNYAWNIYFELFILSLCSLMTWAVHWRQVSSRLELDVTLLLVAVSFKHVVAGLIPRVTYLTLVDVYSLACISGLVLALSMHATIGFLFEDCETLSGDCVFHFLKSGSWMMEAYVLDYCFMGLYGFSLIVFNAGYYLYVKRLRLQVRCALQAGKLPIALKGYKQAQLIREQPTGRSELDMNELHNVELLAGLNSLRAGTVFSGVTALTAALSKAKTHRRDHGRADAGGTRV